MLRRGLDPKDKCVVFGRAGYNSAVVIPPQCLEVFQWGVDYEIKCFWGMSYYYQNSSIELSPYFPWVFNLYSIYRDFENIHFILKGSYRNKWNPPNSNMDYFMDRDSAKQICISRFNRFIDIIKEEADYFNDIPPTMMYFEPEPTGNGDKALLEYRNHYFTDDFTCFLHIVSSNSRFFGYSE